MTIQELVIVATVILLAITGGIILIIDSYCEITSEMYSLYLLWQKKGYTVMFKKVKYLHGITQCYSFMEALVL